MAVATANALVLADGVTMTQAQANEYLKNRIKVFCIFDKDENIFVLCTINKNRDMACTL